MNDNLIKKIFKPAKQVRLEREKKNSIKGAVLMFIKENPLNSPIRKQGFWGTIFSPRLKPVYISISALALVLFIGGTVSVQAESALPGDPFYAVKVGFNEKVLQILAFSDNAKTELNIQLAETRLQEAEKLAVQGNLTPDNQAQIDDDFNEHANAVAKSIDKLNSDKMYDRAEKVASNFEASLKAHSQILEKIKNREDQNSKTQEDMNSLIDKVNGQAEKTSDLNVISVNNVINSSGPEIHAKEEAAQNSLESAQESIDEVKNMIESQQDGIEADAISQIQDNLNLAEQRIADGQDKLSGDNKDYAGAMLLFSQANIIAKQSRNLMKVKNKLGIDIDMGINSNQDGNNHDQDDQNNNSE